MLSKTTINRLIVLAFMVLVGFSLAKGIQSRSTMGIILAITSMFAGVYFMYLLAKAKHEQEEAV
jgi:general stress protein CsbA